MSNHRYASSKKDLTVDMVEKALIKRLKQHVPGMKVVRSEEENDESILVSYPDKSFYACCIWLSSKRKATIRHGSGTEHSRWIGHLSAYCLAQEFGGRIGDDCMSETLDNQKEFCPTFKSYLEMLFGHAGTLGKKIIKDTLKQYPKNIK